MNRSSSAALIQPRVFASSVVLAFVASVIFLATISSQAGAQATTYTSAPPQIVVSANGEVVITPDRANVQLGVETQAKTAALASAENNKKQSAVLAAIKALGIPAASITTSSYSVSPIQRWDEKERKTLIDGYRVSNIVVVNVAKIEQTGAVIDAALASGANRVASLNFELADPSAAREEAISKAVAQARREAEVAAKAVGGSIIGLFEITVSSYEPPRQGPMFAMAKSASVSDVSTPVSEGTLTVQVNVTTRWKYQSRN
ncbi:MAG: SIMPL domain-containing protein [Gemmatimonadaceae bacterium]